MWKVKEVLEHLCLVSDATDSEQTATIATSKQLIPCDELVEVIIIPSIPTMLVFGDVRVELFDLVIFSRINLIRTA